MQDTSSENNEQQAKKDEKPKEQTERPPESPLNNFYYVRFRKSTPSCSAASRISGLSKGDVVMIQTDHGLEPANITAAGPSDLAETGDVSRQKAS